MSDAYNGEAGRLGSRDTRKADSLPHDRAEPPAAPRPGSSPRPRWCSSMNPGSIIIVIWPREVRAAWSSGPSPVRSVDVDGVSIAGDAPSRLAGQLGRPPPRLYAKNLLNFNPGRTPLIYRTKARKIDWMRYHHRAPRSTGDGGSKSSSRL